MNFYARVSSLRSHIYYAFFATKMSVKTRKWCVRRWCAPIVNHNATVNSLCIVHLRRVVFLVRRGPLGILPFKNRLHKWISDLKTIVSCDQMSAWYALHMGPKMSTDVLAQTVPPPPVVRDIPAKFLTHPGEKVCFPWVSSGGNKLLREESYFSTPTP